MIRKNAMKQVCSPVMESLAFHPPTLIVHVADEIQPWALGNPWEFGVVEVGWGRGQDSSVGFRLRDKMSLLDAHDCQTSHLVDLCIPRQEGPTGTGGWSLYLPLSLGS